MRTRLTPCAAPTAPPGGALPRPASSRARAAAAVVLTLALAGCDGGGGGGGGNEDPPDQQNGVPELFVPTTITGLAPTYLVVVPVVQARSFLFAANDPDGDPLRWQIRESEPESLSVGLDHEAPSTGTTLLLRLAAMSVPAATTITMIVEDTRGGATAVDLRIVRTGPPELLAVQPRSAFRVLPQRVTLLGWGFDQGGLVQPDVAFDSNVATDVEIVGGGELTCRTPVDAPVGPAVVTVGHSFGVSALPGVFEFRTFPPAFGSHDQRVGIATDVTGFDVAIDSGRAHAVVTHGLSPVLAYQFSENGGTTWQPPVNLDGFETPTEPRLVVAGDAVGVGWIGDGTSVWFRRPGFPGQRVDDNSAAKRGLRLAKAGERRHATWLEGDALAGTSQLVAAASPDSGFSWTTPVVVAPSPANQLEPTLGASGAAAWVVFADDRLGATARGVYAAHSADGGMTWSEATRLSDTLEAAAAPRACASGDRVHASWLRAGDLLYAASDDGGHSWTPPVAIQLAANGAVGEHAIAVGGDRVCFAFTTGGTRLQLAYLAQPGATLLRTVVDDEPGTSAEPVVHVDADYVFVGWREGDVAAGTARMRVGVSGNGGESFAWRSGFGDGFAAQRQPAFAHDGARLLLGWIDERDGPPFLYANSTQH
jgi:hypothetical protein